MSGAKVESFLETINILSKKNIMFFQERRNAVNKVNKQTKK